VRDWGRITIPTDNLKDERAVITPDLPALHAVQDWGRWAITNNDPDYQGKGSQDTGEERGHRAIRRARRATPVHRAHKTAMLLPTCPALLPGTDVLAPPSPALPGVTGEDYGPAPDLDHANSELREGLKDWLRWLHEYVGFQGWRFDFVKGFAAKYTRE
jgi:hypothetical protein